NCPHFERAVQADGPRKAMRGRSVFRRERPRRLAEGRWFNNGSGRGRPGNMRGIMADSPASTAHGGSHAHPADGTKRDLLELIAGAGAGMLTAGIGWALVGSMNPSKDVLAVSSVEIDLTPIQAGQGITVMWQGKPIFIRHRTDKE